MPALFKQAELTEKYGRVFQDEVRGIIEKGVQYLLYTNLNTAIVCRNRDQVDTCIARTETKRWYAVPKHHFSKQGS